MRVEGLSGEGCGHERVLVVPTTPPRFGDVMPTDFGPPAVGRVL
jgi:hypothetical protein